jgi:hypothetical protein
MYFIGSSQAAMEIATREGEACVRDQIRLKSKIPRHTDGCFHRIVSTHAGDDQRLQPGLAQILLESGPDEGAVRSFRNNGLALYR